MGANILVVDDKPENITVLRDLLKGEGFTVRPALSGEIAVRAARKQVPDLILLDIMMPGLDGYGVCRALKSHSETQEVPILFLSALDRVQDKVRGFEAGAVDYISKPFQAEEVLARIHTHLELRSVQRQLKEQNQQLVKAAQLQEDVDRIMRHDLKGPLTTIIGFAEILHQKAGLEGEHLEYAQILLDSSFRMLDMVNASFDLMKMERGSYRFNPKPVDLNELLIRLMKEYQALANPLGIQLEIKACEGCQNGEVNCLALGDEFLCYSLFSNLLKNAIEASPPGGLVLIEVRVGSQIQVSLRNEGEVPGIIRERFFEKYSTVGKQHGTGLGTYSALLMAKTQGGDIHLDTGEPDFTTVLVVLPIAERLSKLHLNASLGVRNLSEGDPANGEEVEFDSVLLVDDDEGTRLYLSKHLPNFVKQVGHANNGISAFERFQEADWPLVVMDINMPLSNGHEAAEKMRAWERSHRPDKEPAYILGLSASVDDDVIQQSLESGYDAILSKPIKGKDFLNRVNRLLTGGLLSPSPDPIAVTKDLEEILPRTRETWLKTITEIEMALKEGDRERVRELTHRLKGSLKMYGYYQAGEIAGRLEKGANLIAETTLFSGLQQLNRIIKGSQVTFIEPNS